MKIEPGENKSDVDNIIAATAETAVVPIKLNSYIKTGGSCVITSATTFPLTITLDEDASIPIHNPPTGNIFYQLSNIVPGVDSNVKDHKNATMQQQDLDWVMSCELLTEDGAKNEQVDPGTTATTISLFFMSIMIAGAANFVGPIIYTGVGMSKLAGILNDNHYSINVYWGITLVALAILCIVQGVKSNTSIYYFVAIGVILSYFSATSGVLVLGKTFSPPFSTEDGSGFKKTEKAFQIYSEIFSWECYSTVGMILKFLAFFLMVSTFITMMGAVAAGWSQLTFVGYMCIYLLLAMVQLVAIKFFNKLK